MATTTTTTHRRNNSPLLLELSYSQYTGSTLQKPADFGVLIYSCIIYVGVKLHSESRGKQWSEVGRAKEIGGALLAVYHGRSNCRVLQQQPQREQHSRAGQCSNTTVRTAPQHPFTPSYYAYTLATIIIVAPSTPHKTYTYLLSTDWWDRAY